MPLQSIDAAGHEVLIPATTNLAAGAVGVVTAGSISGTTAAGAAPTVAIAANTVCNDRRGSFDLLPVTGGGAQAAGVVATVRFASEYPTPPTVNIDLKDSTSSPNVPLATAPTAVTNAGFDILVAAVLTTARTYRVTYSVKA